MSSGWAPGFLVASPTLPCPFFNHTVVLLVHHDADGAFGFVLNRAAGIAFNDVLSQVGIQCNHIKTTPVMIGGPVSTGTGWLLFDPTQWPCPTDGVIRVADDIALSSSFSVLEALAASEAPIRSAMMLGYAGWGGHQLDQEIREGSWIPVDVDAHILFGLDIESRWSATFAKLGIEPSRMVGGTVASA